MSTMSTIDKICQHLFSREYRLSATNRRTSTFHYKLDMAFTSLSKTRYALAVLFKSTLCIRWLAAAIVPKLLETSFAMVYFLKLLGPWSTTIACFRQDVILCCECWKTCTSSHSLACLQVWPIIDDLLNFFSAFANFWYVVGCNSNKFLDLHLELI